MKNFRAEVDSDGIALITWDMAGRSMNVFDMETIEELDALVTQTTNDAIVKGVVITSAKTDTFSGGADLTMLEAMNYAYAKTLKAKGPEAAAQVLFDESRKLSQVFRRIETCGKPWVAAINGIALGGAFELTLACHHRIAAESSKVRVGLPEVTIGVFPGGGGTQRIARMLPLTEALTLMLKGQQIPLDQAVKMKLIDATAPADRLVQAAKDWIKAGGSAVAPWDTKEFRAPTIMYSKAGMSTFPAANAIYRRETYDNYPAARAIMQCVYEGLMLPMDQALRVESRYFAHILQTKESAAMIRSLFVSMQELNKGARRPADIPPTKVKKLAVIGAGFMGASIGYVSALAGINVVLIDRDQDSADKGRGHCVKMIDDSLAKGRTTQKARDELLARISASADLNAIGDCDLVIEAVFEDRKVKAETYAKAQPLLAPTAIIASNTSTLPITSLATEFKDQSRFIGIHFFSPVEKMALVEIIVGKNTGKTAIATAMDFVRQIRKTPILVNDSRGFFANRCVLNYIAEGHQMLIEGVPPAMIENAGRAAGMPVGPLSLNDEVALDLGLKITKATEADLGAGAINQKHKALLEEMVEKRGRLGRKNGKGFYDYPEKGKGKKMLWPGLADLQPVKLDPDTLDFTELKQRLLVTQAVEAARTVEDHVITDPREADVGSILGFGFAPFTGGTLSYIDFMGTKEFVALCKKLEAKHGPRFAPPQLLIDMAAKGETFYGRFPPKKAAA